MESLRVAIESDCRAQETRCMLICHKVGLLEVLLDPRCDAYFELIANLFLALVQAWITLSPFDAGDFVDAYILLPLSPIMYSIYELWNMTRFWRLGEIEVDIGRRIDVVSAKRNKSLERFAIMRE